MNQNLLAQPFPDRAAAGRALAEKLARYAGRTDVLVLALPRGGVPVAIEVARALKAPLDVFLVRKLGVPGHEELAMGAIASGGACALNEEVVRSLLIPDRVIQAVAKAEFRELKRREIAYRDHRPPPEIRDRTVIVVDDGLATGADDARRRRGACANLVQNESSSPFLSRRLRPASNWPARQTSAFACSRHIRSVPSEPGTRISPRQLTTRCATSSKGPAWKQCPGRADANTCKQRSVTSVTRGELLCSPFEPFCLQPISLRTPRKPSARPARSPSKTKPGSSCSTSPHLTGPRRGRCTGASRPSSIMPMNRTNPVHEAVERELRDIYAPRRRLTSTTRRAKETPRSRFCEWRKRSAAT